jgi:hypothetical protein
VGLRHPQMEVNPKMMTDLKTLTESLSNLHAKLITEIVKRIDTNSASSADLALAWKILTDNGVPLANLREQAGSKELAASNFLSSLPFPRAAQ